MAATVPSIDSIDATEESPGSFPSRSLLTGYFRRRLPAWEANTTSEDLTQEVYMRTLAMAPQPIRSAQAYVWGIARHVLVDHLRSSTREIPGGDAARAQGRCAADWTSPHEPVHVIAGRWLDTQPLILREMFERLVDLDESQTEAAQALQLSRQEFRTQHAKLRSGLRAHLEADPDDTGRRRRRQRRSSRGFS
jgi:DNA-directed RNA polymerase specialized sigma24 family protein